MTKSITAHFSIIICLLFLSGTNAQEVNTPHKDSLNTIVHKYYELNVEVFKANSDIDDINAIFELFTKDFTYNHPKYGGTYTREDLYDGYVRNQKNGGYDGSITAIKTINMIIGLNAVAVEKKFMKGPQEGELEMTLFEFKNGKISKIFEYW